MSDPSPEPPIPGTELGDWIALAKKLLWRPQYRRLLERHGLSLTPARFYNEIPTIQELEEGFEATEDEPYAFSFLSRDAVLATLARLGPFAAEFDPPRTAERGFFWDNTLFNGSDALAYYCFVRLLRPRRVLEVGSGFSSMVALEAARRNGETGVQTAVTCIEPFPKPALTELGVEVIERFVQSFGAEFFNDTLADGDILFIDSTHTVKASSDCCHLYLRVLPNLRRRVTVHVHDIRLPKGVNAERAVARHVYWTEQHLLSAYLLDNPKVRFLFASAFARTAAKAALADFMAGKTQAGGGSFWFELDGRRQAAG